MDIHEAKPDDNAALQALQAKCPQGRKLIVSAVNTPDFFARAKAYESSKVFVARNGNRLICSAACAIRKAVVNGDTRRIGYAFQGFTAPDYRQNPSC